MHCREENDHMRIVWSSEAESCMRIRHQLKLCHWDIGSVSRSMASHDGTDTSGRSRDDREAYTGTFDSVLWCLHIESQNRFVYLKHGLLRSHTPHANLVVVSARHLLLNVSCSSSVIKDNSHKQVAERVKRDTANRACRIAEDSQSASLCAHAAQAPHTIVFIEAANQGAHLIIP